MFFQFFSLCLFRETIVPYGLHKVYFINKKSNTLYALFGYVLSTVDILR